MARTRRFTALLGLLAVLLAAFGARADDLPVPGASSDASWAAQTGKVIHGVAVVLASTAWSDVKVPALRCLSTGDRLTGDKVRACMNEALSEGRFAGATVEALPEDDGVRVTVLLLPRKLVEGVRLDVHGAPLERGELLREAELSEGGEITPRDLPLYQRRLEAFLVKRGYPHPVVTVSTRPTDKARDVIVLLDVAPGLPRKLARRVFYLVGGRREDFEELTPEYAVKVADPADEVALAAADVGFEQRLRRAGFHRAEVSHDVLSDQGFVTLRVRVECGPRYELRFEGNERYDKDTLLAAVATPEDVDHTPSHLVQKLRDFYVRRGYLDVEVSLEERGKRTDPGVFYVFHVRENARVAVSTRAYPCLKEDEIRGLKNGGPSSAIAIGSEIDSYLEEELPGADLFRAPSSAGVDALFAGSRGVLPGGSRPAPLELDPNTVFVPDTYDRAVAHVQELYRSEGYLDARVGPVHVLRRRCDPKSPPGTCRAMLAPPIPELCTYDASNIPLPLPPPDARTTCVPDPAHGIACEPRVTLAIPVKLGPRTSLYDAAFFGAKALTQESLFKAARLGMGEPVSTVKLDEARRRVLDEYREAGYAFAEVKYGIEQSPDHTRARVRFDVTEFEQVIVTKIVVRGNQRTNLSVIEGRVALAVGQPYQASLVRKTQERIATLGTFVSVAVALEDPTVPQTAKTVVINVVEQVPQAIDVRPGFSSDEGVRSALEYTHMNVAGRAITLALRTQASYLPEELVLDAGFRATYSRLAIKDQLRARVSAGVGLPEVGLGPLVKASLDAVIAKELQRDFNTTKGAIGPSATYSPESLFGFAFQARQMQIAVFQTFEYNDLSLFNGGSARDYLLTHTLSDTLVRQLNLPDGKTWASAQRIVLTWDRRDNPFNATSGTLLILGVEHVDAYPFDAKLDPQNPLSVTQEYHFLRLTQSLGGYVPIVRGIRVAALLRMGQNIQITGDSQTYPDRLFFMGGNDSMRGWLNASMLPQDNDDIVFRDQNKPDYVPAGGTVSCQNPADPSVCPNPDKFTPAKTPVRGGNLMFNPRLEVRVPVKAIVTSISKGLEPFETVVFTDIGNLWVDPKYPFQRGVFPMRVSLGTGVRFQTPVGPLAVDYGVNLTKKPYEDFGNFHFRIGLF